MEVESGTEPKTSSDGVASSTAGDQSKISNCQGSVSVALHPLVIMNISDHWTRQRAQSGTDANPTIGAIIGKQNGRHVELMNSFEVVVDRTAATMVIDPEFFKVREEQYKEVFAELEFLGWYTVGLEPTDSDVNIHTQMCQWNDSPVFLKLNPNAGHSDSLPVAIYESLIDIVKGETKTLFIPINYSLATEEAERIGVDHVARVSKLTSSAHQSVLTEQMLAQHGAVKMLHKRLKLIGDYVEAVEAGHLEPDFDTLREIKALCSRLPLMAGQEGRKRFERDFYLQCNDVALMAYLGVLTKTTNTFNELINKLNLINERHHIGTKRMKHQVLF